MKGRITLALVLALAATGCGDNILKERPVAKAVRTASVKPTFSATGNARGGSSVCGAYRRQLRVIELRLLTQSGKAQADELKAKQLSLNAVIADACE